ncbi:MAG: zinc ribbon domain-containing protein [Candidatus Bathyarchaeia archaeon]
MLPPFVDQGATDILWLILPLLCCAMMMAQPRGGAAPQRESVTETWYTVQNIEETFKAIENVTSEWRREAEERMREGGGSFSSRFRRAFGGGKVEARFVVREAVPPRLFRMDDSSGPIYFELTEVEGGGTVVKATYDSSLKSRIAKFKASQPLRIPAPPISDRCPSCGKPVLKEFNLCPYCGEKLIRE